MSNSFNLIVVSAYMEAGGNTLQRHLDSHPSLIHAPFETQLGNSFSSNILTTFYHYRYSWPTIPSDITADQAYNLLYDEETKTYLRTSDRSKFRDCGMIMNESERKALFVDELRGKPINRRNVIEAYYRSTAASWQNHSNPNGTTYVGYYPLSTVDTDRILSDFPDAQIVHIVRNPWSSYASTLTRPFAIPFEKYLQGWNITQLYAHTYSKKYPDQFHIVRFEDLVANKRATMDTLMGKLGLPISDKVYYSSFNGKDLSADLRPWGAIAQSTSEYNDSQAASLSPDIRARIAAECALLIDTFDYARFAGPSI